MVEAAVGAWLGAIAAPWIPLSGACALAILTVFSVFSAVVGRRAALLLPGFAYGLALVAMQPLGPPLEGRTSLVGTVVSASAGRSARVEVAQLKPWGESWRAARGQVRVRFPEVVPPLGSAVVVSGEGIPYREPVLPGAPDPVRNALRVGIRSELRAESVQIAGATPPPARDPFAGARHRGLLRALTLGDRSGVDPEASALLRRTGTSHLLSISGFHTGLVAAMVAFALRTPLRAVALLRPRGFSEIAVWWGAALAAMAFAWAVGAPVSAQRAAAMVFVAALARSLGVTVRLEGVLAWAALGVLTVDPSAAVNAGFQLSFGAVVGLARVSPRFTRLIPPDLPWIADFPLRSLATSLGATAGTLPAAVWWFQEVAPLGPISNLFAIPYSGIAVVPPALFAAWGPAALSPFFATVADWGTQGLLWGLAWSDVPLWHPAAGPVVALLLAAVLVFPRVYTALPAGLLWAVALHLPAPSEPRLSFLDVGQGDAALLEMPSGRRYLVDGGPKGDAVLRYLRRRGFYRLDAVYLTHGHPDHWGGLVPVVQQLRVGALGGADWEGAEPLVEAARLAKVPLVRAPGLWPPTPAPENVNDRSLVLGFRLRGWGVLLTGDIEAESEAALLRRGLPPAAVVKVPHHGSRSSSTEDFVTALSPELAVISAGIPSPFGHPHPEVVARWKAHSTEVLATPQVGTVEVRFTRERLLMRTHAPARGFGPLREIARH